MSSYFRRLIARKIVHTLKRSIPNQEKLVKDIAACIKLNQIHKKTDIDKPQFILRKKNNTDLAVLTDECSSEIKEITADDLNTKESSEGLLSNFEIDDQAIHIKVDSKALNKIVLNKVWNEKENFGYTPLREEGHVQTVVVEYSSPNIAKPFHVGHLRSTIIGNVLANLYEAAGNKVIRLNYLGDWGTQFGLLSYGFKKYGNLEELKSNALHHLFKIYVKVNQDVAVEKKNDQRNTLDEGLNIFKKMEEGNEEELSLWKEFRDLSMAEYSRLYERFGIRYTAYESESMYQEKTKQLVNRLKEENLLQVNESGVSCMEVETSDPENRTANILKSDGTSLYLTRDIAAILDRYDRYKFDKIHYVVEHGQFFHFERLVGVLKKLNVDWPAISNSKEVHLQFGRIQGMSTRKGQAVFLDDIVMEAKEKMLESMKSRKTTKTTENMEENAEMLGLTGLIVQDLMSRRTLSYKFSWEKMLSFNSYSGVFLQYAHARLCSLLQQNENINLDNIVDITDEMINCLHDESAQRLILQMSGYEDAVQYALDSKDPCHITNYLFSLSHLINACYSVLPVKTQSHDIAEARLLMFYCARLTLRNGFKLLGIKPLDQF